MIKEGLGLSATTRVRPLQRHLMRLVGLQHPSWAHGVSQISETLLLRYLERV